MEANTQGCLVPLGDSITQGVPGQPSWRYYLWRSLLVAGLKFTWVGSRDTRWSEEQVALQELVKALQYNGETMPLQHEAHWGERADVVLEGLRDWVADYPCQPTCALVHLGTNDICEGQRANETVATLLRVHETLRATASKHLKVLIAVPIPSCCTAVSAQLAPAIRELGDDDVERRFIVDIEAAFQQSAIPISKPMMVNTEIGMVTNSSAPALLNDDGCHPSELGEEVMAAAWHDAVVRHCGPQPPSPPMRPPAAPPPPIAPPPGLTLMATLSLVLPIAALCAIVALYLLHVKCKAWRARSRVLPAGKACNASGNATTLEREKTLEDDSDDSGDDDSPTVGLPEPVPLSRQHGQRSRVRGPTPPPMTDPGH